MWSDPPGAEQVDHGEGRERCLELWMQGAGRGAILAVRRGRLVHISHQLEGQSVLFSFKRHVSRELQESLRSSGEQVAAAGSGQTLCYTGWCVELLP